jgi:hypothetical protein
MTSQRWFPVTDSGRMTQAVRPGAEELVACGETATALRHRCRTHRPDDHLSRGLVALGHEVNVAQAMTLQISVRARRGTPARAAGDTPGGQRHGTVRRLAVTAMEGAWAGCSGE